MGRVPQMECPPPAADSPSARNALLSEAFRRPRRPAGPLLPNVGHLPGRRSACRTDDRVSRAGGGLPLRVTPGPRGSHPPRPAPVSSFTLKLASAVGGPGCPPSPVRLPRRVLSNTAVVTPHPTPPREDGVACVADPLLTLRREPVPRLLLSDGPGQGPIYTRCPSVIINSSPFHCPKCCSVGDK